MSKQPIRIQDKFYKILTDTGGDQATILLYGFIGEVYDFDYEEGRWRMVGVTDVEFVQELNRLAAQFPVINIRINSPGGDMMHGNAICTAILNCTAEVHTWVDGVAASMAADIWLCGKHRHMAKNGMLMIHGALGWAVGHAQDMRECADVLDKFSRSVCIGTAESLGISSEDMWNRFYADYKDHWMTHDEAVAEKLVNDDTEEYSAENLPEDVSKMTHSQLLKHFEKKNDPEAPGLLERISQLYHKTVQRFAGSASKSLTTQSTPEMNFDDFKKSLADGTLDVESVKTHLASIAPAAPAPADNPEPATPEEPEYVKALRTSIDALQKQVADLGAQPGAQKSIPTPPAADPKTDVGDSTPNALESFNKRAAQAAAADDVVRFTPG